MATSFFLVLMLLLTCTLHANGCYTSIIGFGASQVDTGNALAFAYYDNVTHNFLFLPYGETYFHKPTGRCSDGRLVIDFLAESLGLPLVPPYISVDGDMEDFGQGVNYAVAGATMLDSLFGLSNPSTNASLGIQLEWFKQSLPSICADSSDCRQSIQSSLIFIGDIGGNDYTLALVSGKSINDLVPIVPLVMDTIVSFVNDLIELGAETLVIAGNLPLGCSSLYLTMNYGSNDEEYDNTTGCLIQLNKFVEYHNELLQRELDQIRELHPEVNIIYADYYNAAMQFYLSPNNFGFSNGALKACCGGGGPFNFDQIIQCATPLSTTCANPNTYASWDGLHLTEAAYKLIYNSLFEGSYTIPQFNSLCPIRLRGRGGLSGLV